MPEYPDLTVYLSALGPRVIGQRLEGVRLGSPFVLRSVEPPLTATFGRRVTGVRRIGKQLVFELEGDLFLVLHLMVSGRLGFRARGAKLQPRAGLCAFDFDSGTLLLSEMSSHKRASLHVVRGEAELARFDRGGLEVMTSHLDEFAWALRRENHTLKRALIDPRLFAAIGNAYSDEILHRAKLSPVKLTRALSGEEVGRLYEATRAVLAEWTLRLATETGERWPEKVTAFREGMAVHGRFRQPCPTCGALVQRIVYADNETNYCPRCQTRGKLLADRSLSRLLKDDWPKRSDDLEEYVASRAPSQ